MKRISLILLLVLTLATGYWLLTTKASAQPVYMGLYWITGSVSDPDSVGTEGRQVCFYERLENNSIVGGYSDDLVGTVGLSGRTNQYMINALEDWRLDIAPGKYYVAIVQGSDGYGADPVEVTVTGQGYDIVGQNLVLMRGAGINPPAERPTFGLPNIQNIRFGNRLYQPVLVAKGQPFIVSAQPRISATAASDFGVDRSRLAMVVNAGTAQAKTYTISSSQIVRSAGPSDNPTEVDFVIDLSVEKDTLPEGDQQITFRAANVFGSTEEVCTVTVAGGEPRLIGIPITFPSPLHLKTEKEVFFQYTMTHDIPVDLFVFDVSGRVVLKRSMNAREEGGSAGVNKVSWNLITDQGSLVSSGIYVFTLVNKENGKMLGKGKFTALP
ncbi:MAG: hypothetical protein JW782_01095 [Candidatus Saganbacteria bacterium]|nr:hypothetical protein [Candidatus Saganbacteria bacterium]